MSEQDKMPEMNEADLKTMAAHILQDDLSEKSYADIVKMLTVCNFVGDLCLVEIDRRGQLAYVPDYMPIVPDARPQHMWFSTPIMDVDDP